MGLQITIDPRIELIQTCMYLTGMRDKTGQCQARYAYTEALAEYFAPFADSDAVVLARGFIEKNFRHVKPNRMAVGLGTPPDLEEVVSIEAYINSADSELVQTAQELRHYLTALRKFASESGFMDFFASQEHFYSSSKSYLRQAVKDEIISQLEEYFGSSLPSYTLIGSPLCGNYGFMDTTGEHAYCICMAPRHGKTPDELFWPTAASLVNTVRHEFGHCFINKLTYANMAEVQSWAKLKEAHKATPNAYNWWPAVVNESIIRACQGRFFHLYPQYALSELGERWEQDPREEWLKLCQDTMGFVLVRSIERLLQEYEDNRHRYSDFSEFYPVILEWFKRANEQI